MFDIFRALVDFKQLKFNHDDDLPDRISRQYSTIMLLVMAMIVSARQYLGQAIHCWCPEMCAENHETYANVMCWVDDTYYVPFLDRMPQADDRKDRKITYYQWVPIILMLQAIMFALPRFLWKLLNGRSGINIGTIIEAAEAMQTARTPEERDKNLRFVVHLMDRYLMKSDGCCPISGKRSISKGCCFLGGGCLGNYLSCCYLLVKIVYLINATGQLFLLNVFLGYEFHAFGVQVLDHLINGQPWTGSERFPLVTLCDFRIRQNTNVHQYTVQCVLPINIFNEKVFVIVWFWLVIVGIVTLVSLLQWMLGLLCLHRQVESIRNHLLAVQEFDRLDLVSFRLFINKYLRRDGLFVLRLVEKNAGQLVATEVFSGLWLSYGPKFNKEDSRTVGQSTTRRTRSANATLPRSLTKQTQERISNGRPILTAPIEEV